MLELVRESPPNDILGSVLHELQLFGICQESRVTSTALSREVGKLSQSIDGGLPIYIWVRARVVDSFRLWC